MKLQDAVPGVGGRVGVLLVRAIEEGMRRSGVCDHLAAVVGSLKRSSKGVDLRLGDAGVVSGHEGEHRTFHLRDPPDDGRRADGKAIAVGMAVEADGTGEAVPVGGLLPRVASAEAEAHRDQPTVLFAIAQEGGSRRPTSLRMPSWVVWCTWGMKSNPSSRDPDPAVRPK